MMGFIFFPRSERFVRPDIYELISQLPVKKTGVFVNAPTDDIINTADVCRLDYIQLHGDEPAETCRLLKDKGLGIIKAFRISNEADFALTADYEMLADYFLFDTQSEKYGGSGIRFDWSLLRDYTGNTPFLLSGGIRPESADDILNLHHAMFAGIDLNSGFETSPAIKDANLLHAFIRKL
jgi:phosphoribosylanthranilate isomerase